MLYQQSTNALMMDVNDTKALRDMLDATAAAMSLVQGQLKNQLLDDVPRIQGIVKAMEWIDRSAQQVSPECQAMLSDVPWSYIIGIYDNIVLPGDEIDLRALWFAISEVISPLQFALEQALPPDEDVLV